MAHWIRLPDPVAQELLLLNPESKEHFMRNQRLLKPARASIFWAGALFGLCLLWTTGSSAINFPLQCSSVFHSNADLLIPMNPQYRGEDRGLYMDPLTRLPWKVKYFTHLEREAFQLFLKDGLFVNRWGHKAESRFDSESLTFDQGLFLIDKNFQFFLLPFESRGEYHHSSLSRGEDVIFAGTASFSNGFLREISNTSGHYKPDSAHTLRILRSLAVRGVKLTNARLSGKAAEELGRSPSLTAQELKKVLESSPSSQ